MTVRAYNPKVVGSNATPATKFIQMQSRGQIPGLFTAWIDVQKRMVSFPSRLSNFAGPGVG
jgi:hypothetical protein